MCNANESSENVACCKIQYMMMQTEAVQQVRLFVIDNGDGKISTKRENILAFSSHLWNMLSKVMDVQTMKL